jgi:hypothetical protein
MHCCRRNNYDFSLSFKESLNNSARVTTLRSSSRRKPGSSSSASRRESWMTSHAAVENPLE